MGHSESVGTFGIGGGGSGGFFRRGAGPGHAPAPTAAPADRRPRLDGVPVDSLPPILPEARRGARRRVTVVGEPVLRRTARPVTEFDAALATLIDDLFTSMEIASGVGLAANQVGIDLRVFVYDCTDTWDVRHVGHVVNPVLELPPRETGSWQSREEGCLSVPGPSAEVERSLTAAVTGQDRFGRPIRVEGHGFFARCLQHECDHLAGRLYVDHLTPKVRRGVLRGMDDARVAVWAAWDDRARHLGKAGDVGQCATP